MCSINGFNFKDESLIKRMVSETKYRGPDQEGFYCDDNFSLGHARLSIIDLSEKGRQPIWNEDRSKCIVCNGEIYNFQELKNDLQEKGHRFFSGSDSEIILHLYEEKKENCLELLNGIFSFAIYDKNEKKIFLARDRIGIKPLYFYYDGRKFIFASEIKAILTHPIPRRIDEEALMHYFRIFFVPSPFTLFNNIRKLPPAHYLVFKNGKIEMKRYWDIPDLPEVASKEEAIEGIKALLKDSIKRQLISDRPLGVFLSGGVDSTSVLGISSELTAERIKTYTVGFDIKFTPEKYNGDFRLARKTAEYYGTDHHELLISDRDARDSFEKVIWHMEEPVPNPTQIPTFLLAKEAKKEVAVLLGGDGGDEIFGGYPRYFYSKMVDYYQKLPYLLRKNIPDSLFELFSRRKDLKEKLAIPSGVSRYLMFMGQKSEMLSRVLKTELKGDKTLEFLRESYPEGKFKDRNKYLMYLDLMTWLPDESLLRSDKMTMAWGLEERVPILDHRLAELAFRIPTKYKIKGRKSWKWIFREAVKEYLPSHLTGEAKRGWLTPAGWWLRGELKNLAYEVLSPSYCRETERYFKFPEIKEILDDHISGKQHNMDIIWSLLTFQMWHKTFI